VTLTQSDVNDLLDALRAGGDIDVIRQGVELVLQALIDAEATEHIGAGHYERTETRTAQRNGGRDRLLATKAGDVELKIPKAPQGQLLPVDPRAASPDRPSAVRRGDGGLRTRREHVEGR
jgi:transposase-like protein